MLPLAAYADRLSARPGEKIQFHVANATGQAVDARIVRVICADANPAGPGVTVEPVAAQPAELCWAGPQVAPQGSYGAVDGIGALLGNTFTLMCRAFPTVVSEGEQTVLNLSAPGDDANLTLLVGPDGIPMARLKVGGSTVEVSSDRVLSLRRWHALSVSIDVPGRSLSLAHKPMSDPMSAHQRAGAWSVPMEAQPDFAGAVCLFGATSAEGSSGQQSGSDHGSGAQAVMHWNGKLEAPAAWDKCLAAGSLLAYADGDIPPGFVACWDFAREVSSDRIVDVGASGLHGRLINCPTRAVTGSAWTGREMRFRDAPEQYGAIHFHADDLDDCGWPAAYEWTVPEGCRSAVYALMLEAGDAAENVPFHVVPPKGRPGAKLAVLASTFTYTIYGNHARLEWDINPQFREDWHAQAKAWGAYPYNPGDHREYGLSTYNDHVDGSGISVASWHRPMLNVRIGYITYPYEHLRGSGLRHFPADTHLTAWLETKGYDYDIITDWELHTEGVDVLSDYAVVLTGSHPEYHTPATLEALTSYRDQGGRLCYLGGNGFYWKIAASPVRDGVIEIRRGEGGIRAWAAEPGEYYNQFDGEYGGMWRRNGRPPQNLCGVGFTAQGNFSGSYYRKRPEADDPRVAWMFDGVDGETFGAHGLSGHGAAGFELDRADKLLGTPVHAVVAASSEDHPPEVPWILVPEEVLTHLATWSGESAEELIRADLTFFETPAGGAVFSTGSITFCGSLVTNGFDNDVSALTDNVLRRFLDPEPFVMPDR